MFNTYTKMSNRGRHTAPPQRHEFYNDYRPLPIARAWRRNEPIWPTRKSYCKHCLDLILERERLKSELKQLKNNVEKMLRERETEVRDNLATAMDNLKRENHRLRGILSVAQVELDRVRNTLVEQVDCVRERYKRSLENNAELEELVRQKEKEVWDLKRKVRDNESQMESLEDLIENQEHYIKRMDRELFETQRKNDGYRIALLIKDHENESLWKRCDDLVKEKETLKKALKDKEQSIKFAHGKKVEEEVEKLKKQLHMTSEELNKSEENRKMTSRKLELVEDENGKLRKELEDRKTEKELDKRKSRYWGMSQNNEIDADEHSLWIKKFTELQNKYQTLLNRNTYLEKENGELGKKFTELQNKHQTLLNRNTSLEKENEELRKKWRPSSVPHLDARFNEMETLKRELVAVKELNKDLEEKQRRLIQEKNDMELMHSNAIRRKENEVFATKKSLEDRDIELKSLRSKLIDFEQAQLLSRTSEYQRLYEDAEKLRKEISSLKMTLEQCRKNLEETEKVKRDTITSRMQLEEENRRLRDQLSQIQKEEKYDRNSKAGDGLRDLKIQSLEEHITKMEKEYTKLQEDFFKISKERDIALGRKDDVEKELTTVKRRLQDNLNQFHMDNRKRQEENARETSKIYGETEKQLNDMRTEMLHVQKRVTQLESENAKLRESIDDVSKEKENALKSNYEVGVELNNSKREVQQKIKEIQRLQEIISQKETETKKLQKELSDVLKGRDSSLQRNKNFEQMNQHLQESLNASQAENKLLQEKVSSATEKIEKIQMQINSMSTESRRLKERVKELTTENSQLREDIAEVSKEKDNALTRLSKVAGAKLTHGNAAITDLSDTNRPTKLAEKFSELYDNQWTDAFEELDNTYNNEEMTIQVLLKILQEAYTFCVRTETNYEARIGQAVFTLADENTNETRQITGADVPVQKALTDLRLSLGNACCSIVEEMFLARLPSILKKVDISVSPKTKLYARQCASLCWRMRIRDPPVFVRFEFRRGTEFNTDILRRYTKTGGYLDFIVWPALYLHENGPVLSKGVAQPKHSP